MNSFKIKIIVFVMFLAAINANADNHDSQNIIDKAKEINQKVKEKDVEKFKKDIKQFGFVRV